VSAGRETKREKKEERERKGGGEEEKEIASRRYAHQIDQ